MSPAARRWIALLLPGLAVAALVARFAWIAGELPARVAIHFDAEGRPNGWMGRAPFGLSMTTLLLAELGVSAWALGRLGHRRFDALIAGLLSLFIVAETAVFWEVLEMNRGGSTPRWGRVIVAAAVAALVPPLAAFLAGHDPRLSRASPPSGEAPLAVERHVSRARFWINLPFCLGLVIGWFAVPGRIGRGVVLLLAAITGYFMALIWTGFRYRFLRSGVDVRGLRRSLQFVPAAEIRSWDVRPIDPLRQFGGWGIRGGGATRAYVWGGRRALRLETSRGEIWLGHDDPDRLAACLERLKRGGS
jgi:uncharacterized protein DUF1648